MVLEVRHVAGLAVLGVVIGVAAGCDDTIFNVKSEAVEGEGWEAVVEVFDGNCVSCHSAAGALGGLDLETDPCGAIVGVEASAYDGTLVVAGDSAASVLYAKVADTGEFGGVMPTGGAMEQSNIDIIGNWIADGASCDGTGGGDDGGSDTWDGDYTFSEVQTNLFDTKCVYCHSAGGSGEDLLLDEFAYDDIVDIQSSTGMDYIEPGDPSNSYLYLKVTADESIEGDPMPSESGLTDLALLDLLEGWINAGAPE